MLPLIAASAYPNSRTVHAKRMPSTGAAIGPNGVPLCGRGNVQHRRPAAEVTCPRCLQEMAEQGLTLTRPTVDQLLNLADRAERGLTPAEADRLRAGITALAADGKSRLLTDLANLQRRNRALRAEVRQLRELRERAALEVREPDPEARAAVTRVRNLAGRWLHVPALQRAAQRVLAALDNADDDTPQRPSAAA